MPSSILIVWNTLDNLIIVIYTLLQYKQLLQITCYEKKMHGKRLCFLILSAMETRNVKFEGNHRRTLLNFYAGCSNRSLSLTSRL